MMQPSQCVPPPKIVCAFTQKLLFAPPGDDPRSNNPSLSYVVERNNQPNTYAVTGIKPNWQTMPIAGPIGLWNHFDRILYCDDFSTLIVFHTICKSNSKPINTNAMLKIYLSNIMFIECIDLWTLIILWWLEWNSC